MTDVMTASVRRLPDLSTVTTGLALRFDDSFAIEVSEVGSGSLTLPLDASILTSLHMNDVILFAINGTVYAGSLIEMFETHTLDENGASKRWARLTGNGIGKTTNWGVIQPANGAEASPPEDDRLLSWQAPQYDDSDWDEPVFTNSANHAPNWPWLLWLHGRAIAGPGSTESETPAGAFYLRRTFTLDEDTDVKVVGTADNWGRIWLDGQDLLRLGEPGTASYRQTFETDIFRMTAGPHTFAIRGLNQGSDNPGGARMLLLKADTNSTVLLETDLDWLAKTGGDPGVTPGEAVLWILGEIQDRGGLGFITPTFTATTASGGGDWSEVGDIVTRTGTDLLTFLTELATTYIDWQLRYDADDNDFKLDLFNKGHLVVLGPSPDELELTVATSAEAGSIRQLDTKRT